MNRKTYLIKTNNLLTIATDTFDGWRETFEFLKAEGIEITAKPISDYLGPMITSDMIFPYHHTPDECPVNADNFRYMI